MHTAYLMFPVAYLGGHWAMPPFGPNKIFLTLDKNWKTWFGPSLCEQ